MSFTLETTLTTIEPNVVVLFGPPNPAVEYEILGRLDLHVHNEIELGQLLVAFSGEAHEEYKYPNHRNEYKSQTVNIARSEFHALQAPTVFQPGKYDFPFRLRVPGDVAATHCQHVYKGFFWGYELIAVGVPSNLSESNTRQVIRQPLTLERIYTMPPGPSLSLFRIKRAGALECAIRVPKIVSVKDTSLRVSMDLNTINRCPGVKKIRVEVIQTSVLNFDYAQLIGGFRRFWVFQPTILFPSDTTAPGRMISSPPFANAVKTTKILSNFKISNPHKKKPEIAAWGGDKPIEFDLELDSKELTPSETVTWLSVTHGVHFTISFINEGAEPLMFVAPFQICKLTTKDKPSEEYELK
ncbi:hypothetical protein BGX27_008063 [Mortierella sp. AM989]|nr:hypothetical protein BGX27_008063 [Mortierella sp. AM989]